MTKQEELQYLIGIVTEASKWTPSPDDQRDLVRMEVEERINNLVMGVEPEPDENGLIQSTIHPDVPDNPVDEPLTTADYQALEAARLNDYIEQRRSKERIAKDKWKKDKVRVYINGKSVWKLRSECRKVPRWPDKPEATGWKWEWVGPQEVDKLGDELWKDHERS